MLLPLGMIRKLLFLLLFLPLLAHSQQTTVPTGATLKAAPSWYLGLDGRAIPYFSGKYYPLMTIQGMAGYQPRIIGNKPAPTGTSYGATDSISQIVANLDSGIRAGTRSRPPYGTIYNNSNFTSLSDFTQSGGITASVLGGALFINNPATPGTDITHTLDLNTNAYNLPNWTFKARIIAPASAAVAQTGVGMKSWESTDQHELFAVLDVSNSATAGRLRFLAEGGAGRGLSVNNLTYSPGDTIEIVVTRLDYINFEARAINISHPATNDVYISYNSETQGRISIGQNTGTYTLYANSPTQIKYISLNITSTTPRYADIGVLSDSKWGGYLATAYATSIVPRLSQFYNIVHLSGGGDRTTGIIAALPSVLRSAPKVVIVDAGRNDMDHGSVPLSTVIANLQTIYNTLTSNGIKVWICTGEYETANDYSAFAAAVKSTFPNNYIDTYAWTKANPSSVQTDGVHISDVGSDIITNNILALNLVNSIKTFTNGVNNALYTPNFYGPVSSYGGTINLLNPTSNVISLRNVGSGAPTFTTRSIGTKFSLFASTITASAAEYAMGVETNFTWFGVPTTAAGFKFYGGTTLAGTLTGTGNLSIAGTLTGSINALGTSGTTFLTHTGGLIQSRTAAQVLQDINGQAALSGTGIVKSTAGVISYLTDPLPATNGGTAQSTYATGDLLYASAANTLSKRTIGGANQVLTSIGGVPIWAAPAVVGVTNVTSANSDIAVATGTTTPVLTFDRTHFPYSTFSGIATNDILQYNGSAWQNAINTYNAPLYRNGSGNFIDTTATGVATRSYLNQYAKLNQPLKFTNDVTFAGPNFYLPAFNNSGYVIFGDAVGRLQQSSILKVTNSAVLINEVNPNSSALLTLTSTSKGVMLPRLTLAQRNAMVVNAEYNSAGTIYYQTDNNPGYYYFDGANWNKLSTPPSNTVSSASTLTLSSPGAYTFTGTTSTWTLPSFATSGTYDYLINNVGSGDITVNTNGGEAVAYINGSGGYSTFTVLRGESYRVYNSTYGFHVIPLNKTRAPDNVFNVSANTTIDGTYFLAGNKSTLDLYVNATSGNITIALPSAVTFAGYTIYVTKTDASANTVTINTVVGSNTLTATGQSRQFNSNNSSWYNH